MFDQPQLLADDKTPRIRSWQLKLSRRLYEYNHAYIPQLAMIEDVPSTEEFSYRWMKKVGKRALKIIANHLELRGDEFIGREHSALDGLVEGTLSSGLTGIISLRQIVEDVLELDDRHDTTSVRPRKLEDYADLFRKIDLPPIHRDFEQDEVFAWMRIAGPNPVMIQRVTKLDKRFPVSDPLYASAIPGDTLEAAGQEGRLFLADYRLLENAQDGTYPHGQKYLHAPLALFALDPESRHLRPIAIQCGQQPGRENPIFSPKDGNGWLMAKTVVQIADGNMHELVTHLARTHLFLEPFVVATHRQLAKNHPLYFLLTPHFDGTLAINEAAHRFLIADKGPVDKLTGAQIQDSQRIAVQAVQTYSFNDQMLPKALQVRGVDDLETFPVYPYRDDSLLYWKVIHQWVGDYIGIYYKSNRDVLEDAELEAWHRELVSHSGGRISGFGQQEGIKTIEALVDALTLIVFTASVQHAAVNFPQYDLMSYTPNIPLAGYAPAPIRKQGLTREHFLEMLPPIDMAELQMVLGYLLGSVHHTRLGEYGSDHFPDKRVKAPLKAFKERLASIGEIIEQRNLTRRPYNFLRPTGIPQSVNI